MREILKKSFDKFDGLIILAAVFLFVHFDYGNLSLIDKVYIASFAVWSVMKIVRVYITFKNEREDKEPAPTNKLQKRKRKKG